MVYIPIYNRAILTQLIRYLERARSKILAVRFDHFFIPVIALCIRIGKIHAKVVDAAREQWRVDLMQPLVVHHPGAFLTVRRGSSSVEPRISGPITRAAVPPPTNIE